jgi:hypothetical protein
MTLIPAKHTFTIWSGATFFEVLTLYSTNDQTKPRDFYSSTSITGITVSPNGTSNAILSVASGDINAKLSTGTYYISSPNIPAANNVYFTISSSIPTGSSYTATLYQNGIISSNGIGTATNEVAVITKRTINYEAEMIIREKPQGFPLFTLSSTNGRIIFPIEIESIGQIRLLISDTDTAELDWRSGVYDLTLTEILNPVTKGVTTDALLYGGIKVAGV